MSIKRPSIIIGMVVATVLVAENLISGASAGVITPGLSVVDIAAASSDNELRPDHYRPFCGEILRACSAAKELVLPLNGSIFGKRSYEYYFKGNSDLEWYRRLCNEVVVTCFTPQKVGPPLNGSIFGKRGAPLNGSIFGKRDAEISTA